jgi:hypothetical protein
METHRKVEIVGQGSDYEVAVEHLASGNVVLRQNDQTIVIGPRWIYEVTRAVGHWVMRVEKE